MWLYSTSIVLEIVELHIRYRQQTLQWWKRLTSNRRHTQGFVGVQKTGINGRMETLIEGPGDVLEALVGPEGVVRPNKNEEMWSVAA